MRFIVLCSLIAIAVAAPADGNSTLLQGCVSIGGECTETCEEGTHAYTPGCGYLVPEATCDTPNPVAGTTIVCDFSACFCDDGTVRDTTTNQCVELDNCP